MSGIQAELLKAIKELSEDKLIKVLSYVSYLKTETDDVLELADEEEAELLFALQNEERIPSAVVEQRFN